MTNHNTLVAWERRGSARAALIVSERGAASVTLIDRSTVPWRAVIGVGLTVSEATCQALNRWTSPDAYAVESPLGGIYYELPQPPDKHGRVRPPMALANRDAARTALVLAEQLATDGRAA